MHASGPSWHQNPGKPFLSVVLHTPLLITGFVHQAQIPPTAEKIVSCSSHVSAPQPIKPTTLGCPDSGLIDILSVCVCVCVCVCALLSNTTTATLLLAGWMDGWMDESASAGVQVCMHPCIYVGLPSRQCHFCVCVKG